MIIDIISDVCASLSKRMDQQINYIYGDSSYIRETLLLLGKSRVTALGKFPMIGLYVPLDEERGSEDFFLSGICKHNNRYQYIGKVYK